jgi:hypothetical protein
MKTATYVVCFALILLGVAASASGQAIISAKSGAINYTEGQVTLDDKDVVLKATTVTQMQPAQVLKTGDGRAEILLSPGVFLRAGENSSLKLLSDQIVDTRLELIGGSIIIECAEFSKDASVTVLYKDATVSLEKSGLYRIDSEPAALRVYDGEATVQQSGQSQTVKKGRLLPLNGMLVAEKFDAKTGDALFRWARRRAEYVAMANPVAARLADKGRYSFGGLAGGWIYNPYMGMFTFVPMGGIYRSFWGYSFWSPGQVYMVYSPRVYTPSSGGLGSFGGGALSSRGYSGVSMTSSGTSGVAAVSAPPSAASSAGSVSVPRESGSAGSRNR